MVSGIVVQYGNVEYWVLWHGRMPPGSAVENVDVAALTETYVDIVVEGLRSDHHYVPSRVHEHRLVGDEWVRIHPVIGYQVDGEAASMLVRARTADGIE